MRDKSNPNGANWSETNELRDSHTKHIDTSNQNTLKTSLRKLVNDKHKRDNKTSVQVSPVQNGAYHLEIKAPLVVNAKYNEEKLSRVKSTSETTLTTIIFELEKHKINDNKVDNKLKELTQTSRIMVNIPLAPKKYHTFNENDCATQKGSLTNGTASSIIVTSTHLNGNSNGNSHTNNNNNSANNAWSSKSSNGREMLDTEKAIEDKIFLNKPVLRTGSNIVSSIKTNSTTKKMFQKAPREFLLSPKLTDVNIRIRENDDNYKASISSRRQFFESNTQQHQQQNAQHEKHSNRASPMAKSLPSYDEALKRAIAESKMTSSTTSNNTLQHQQQQQQQYQQQLHNTLADFAQKTSSTSTTTTTTTMAASSETNGFGSYQPSAYNGFKTRNVLPTLPMQSTFKSLLSLPINANGSGGGGGGGANQNGASNGKLVSATPLNNNHNHNNIANNNAKVYFRPQDFRNTNTSNNNAAANTHSNNNNNNNNGNIPTSVSVQLTSTNSNSAAVNHITTTTTTTTGNSININNMSNTSNGGGSGSTSNLPNAFATDKSNSDKLRFMSQKNVTERLYNGLPVSKTPIIVSAAPPTLTVNGGGGSTSTASTIHNHASSGTNNNNLNANGSSRRSNPSPQSAAVSTAGGIKLPIATSAPALPATAAPTTQPASSSSASFKSSLIEPSHHQHQHHAHNGIASTQRSLSFKDNLNHMQQQQTTSSIAVNGIISSSSEYRSGSDLKMHYQQQQQHHHQHHPIVNSSSSHEVAASINIVNNNNNNNSSSNNNAAGYTPTIKTVTSQQHHHHHNHHQHQHQQQQQSAHLMKTAGAGNGSDSIFMRVQSPIPIIKDQRLTNANANANATSGSDEQQQQHRTASVSTTPSLVRPSPVLVHSNYQPSVSHDKASSNNNNNNNTNSSNSKQAPSDTTTATTTNNNNNNNKTQPPRDAYSITGSSAVNSFELNNMNTAAEQQLTAVAAIKQQLTATNKTAIKTNPMIFISNSGGGGHKPMATKQDAPNVDVDVEKFATALNEAAASVEKLSNNNNNNNDNNEYSASTLTAGGKSAPVVKPQQVFDPLASAATNTMDDVSTLKSAATINHVNNNNRQTITSNSRSNVLNSKSTTNLALNEHTTNPHHHQQHQQPHNSLNKSEDDNESFTFSVSSTPSLAPNESGNDTSSANASRSQNNNNNNNNNERKAINNARRDGAATPATYTGSKQQQQQMHDARAHLRSPLCKDAPLLSANVIGGQRGPLVANLNRHHSSSQSPSKAPMTAGVAGARRQPVMSEASTMDRPPSRLNYYDSDTNTFSDGLVANELLARRAGAGSRVAGGPSAFSNRKDLITDSPNLSDITERNFDEIEGAHRTSTPNTSKHKRSSSISSNELKHIKRQIQDLEKMYYEIFRIIDSERRSAASSSFSRSTSISSFASSSDMPTEQQQQPQTQQSTKQVHRRKSIVNFTNSDGRASQLHHERHSMRVVSNAPIGDHDNLNEMNHLRSRFNRIESHLTLLAKTVAKISVEMKSIKIIQDVVCKLRNDVNCLKSFNSSNFTSVAGGLKELHRHNSDPNIQFNNNNGNNGNHPHAATNIRFNGQNGNNNNNNNNNNMQRNSAASGNALVTSASGVAVHTVTTTQSPRPQQNNNNNNNNADQIDDEETRLGDGGRKPTSDQMRRHQENMANEKENLKAWVPSYSNPKKLKKLTKFFGQEPPMLRMFLQKLNYEIYAPKFENEHITITELPYLSEERLKSLGIPLGPRLRILREAQNSFCFDYINK